MKSADTMTQGAGTNRTGIALSQHADQMRQVTGMTHPSADHGALKQAHAFYLERTHSVGSVPPPGTARGALKTAWEAVKGNKAIALVDKSAERLAFERTGVRLYDALLEKLDVAPAFAGGPEKKAVQTIRDEELEHARMLADTMEELGADPTALTPSADLVAVESMGLGTVMGDPRTSVPQCLHALLVAELADNEGWSMLRSLADEMGQEELATRFARAEADEDRHLELVRGWLKAHARAEAEIG
ncbi:MAG: ferritin-like domain-containing protein [Pseudomonadota bacterium]